MKQRTQSTGPLLTAAAAEPLSRIREDRERVEAGIRPMLVHLEDNLFDYNLNVTSLRRQCGVRDNGFSTRFTSALGKSPWAYIEQRRLETACWLLAETHLPVWQIGELVGYSGLHVFSRAFERWSGVRPRVYRQKPEARPVMTSGPSIDSAGPASPDQSETVDNEVGNWRRIQPWPDLGEVPCHRVELWLPADVHNRLGLALSRLNRLSGDDQQRLTERDLIIAALVDWLPAISPPHERL
jgi:AraC-like DNA-binding protein